MMRPSFSLSITLSVGRAGAHTGKQFQHLPSPHRGTRLRRKPGQVGPRSCRAGERTYSLLDLRFDLSSSSSPSSPSPPRNISIDCILKPKGFVVRNNASSVASRPISPLEIVSRCRNLGTGVGIWTANVPVAFSRRAVLKGYQSEECSMLFLTYEKNRPSTLVTDRGSIVRSFLFCVCQSTDRPTLQARV
jgi:hypothetical protein